ncbi:MAG TPA: hypothetical protein VMV10_05830 [Pirellulales bacterium]|nr:hypothetical protein [Pirellulales bacterium]
MAKQATASRGAPSATHDHQTEGRWRYVWHNDRWWYWTTDERWLFFNGRRWIRYDPRSSSSGALAAGYRKAPAFEKPPAAAPRPPGSWPAAGAEIETELLESYYLEGRPMPAEGLPLGGESPAVLGGFGSALGGKALGPAYGGGERTVLPTPGGGIAPRTGGGGFGGPTGSSLGAGSAAGGASTPR